MKIALILPTLQGGGAEKVYINIGEYFKYKLEHEFDIIIFKDLIDYETSLNVINVLSKNEKITKNLLKFLKNLYKILKNYDIIISGLELEPNYIAILYSKILKKPCICTHHSQISKLIDFEHKKKKFLYQFLNILTLRFANMNIAVSKEAYYDIMKNYKIPKEKCMYIYNPIDLEKVRNLANESIEKEYEFIFRNKTLCFVGRLQEYKGLKKVIKALKYLESYNLIVLGKGNFEAYNKHLEELNLKDRVFYLGFKRNPYKYINKCFALVLPSEFEGFGLVFYEAMALGIPIVGSGIKETFGENNEYGIYANSVEEIISAIKTLENPEIYEHYRRIGLERVKNFKLEKIAKQYEEVILKILT
ncbi:MAG: glycosyltransferase [candidate division WOR-3 bacterium]